MTGPRPGLYCLGRRYYDPEAGRFISPDDVQNINCKENTLYELNLYAYCDNNPVKRSDRTGSVWDIILDLVTLGTSIYEVSQDPTDLESWFYLALDVVDVAVPIVSGLGEGAKACRTASKLSKVDDVVTAAKDVYSAADAFSDLKRKTGTYLIIYKSGMEYVGKGGFGRAITSAQAHAKPPIDQNKSSS